MEKKELIEVLSYIRDEYAIDTKEIKYGLEYINLALDGIKSKLNNNLNKLYDGKNYTEIEKIIDKSKLIDKIQDEIMTNYNMLTDEETEELEEIEEENILNIEMDDEKKQETLPDYKKYIVNDKIAHSLYEDFTHTRVCGFDFKGKHYEAANMQVVLVKMCGLLYEIDKEIMLGLVENDNLKGKKVYYLLNKEVVEKGTIKSRNIPGSDIYVWVNLSSNLIIKVIKKLLKKYGFSFNDLKIYLRADYKELHSKSEKNNLDDSSEITDMVIPDGIYKFSKKKKSDNKTITATVEIKNGRWTLLNGSVIGMVEDKGVNQKAKIFRAALKIDDNGSLLEDAELGECSPSLAGTVVMNQSINGWTDWYNSKNEPMDIYRNPKIEQGK